MKRFIYIEMTWDGFSPQFNTKPMSWMDWLNHHGENRWELIQYKDEGNNRVALFKVEDNY